MSKGSNRRPTLNKKLAEKNWAEFERNRKRAREQRIKAIPHREEDVAK